jgi:hypothetical protein
VVSLPPPQARNDDRGRAEEIATEMKPDMDVKGMDGGAKPSKAAVFKRGILSIAALGAGILISVIVMSRY